MNTIIGYGQTRLGYRILFSTASSGTGRKKLGVASMIVVPCASLHGDHVPLRRDNSSSLDSHSFLHVLCDLFERVKVFPDFCTF